MTALLSCQGASFGYEGAAVVRAATLTIEPGELWALLGPNGAGKSTLIRGLAGLVPAREGRVLLGDRAIDAMSARERARSLAWLSQEDMAPEAVTVEQLVALGRAPFTRWHGALSSEDRAAVDEALAWASMSALRARFVSELSGGERRRAALARVRAQRASVLLFDEPTAFLDPKQQWWVVDAIARMAREERAAAAMVLHDPALALRFATHVALMRDGAIVAEGETSTVLTREALRAVFDVDAQIGVDPSSGVPYVVTVHAREAM